MLFISENPSHVVIRSATKALYDDKGRQIRPETRRVYAKFERGTTPTWAVPIGLETFPLLNRPVEVTPESWLACYDSEADQWNDEERKAVEERLVALGYTKVERPRVTSPYPMYDKHRAIVGRRTIEHAIEDIKAAYNSAGFDLEHAVEYEKENGNDEKVIAALNGLIEAGDEAEKLIEA